MIEYYVFETEEIATGAKEFIDTLGGFPRTGTNVLTKEPMPKAAKTLVWDIPIQRLDGKWVMKRLPEIIRNQYADSESYFDSNFPHVLEDYSASWFNTGE